MTQRANAANRCQRQRGVSAVEFALVAVPLLLIGLLVVEVGSALAARQMLRLALHEAVRAGAVQHGNPQVMGAAFEAALAPWYAPAGRYATPLARLRASHIQLQRDTGLALWQLEILGPSARAFADFGVSVDASADDPPDGRAAGRRVIANAYLAEQHARVGVGAQSGLTIFDANVLHLRALWLRRPMTPLTGAALKAAAQVATVVSASPPDASVATSPATSHRALAAGLLPLVVEERMTMHSDPWVWQQTVVSASALR